MDFDNEPQSDYESSRPRLWWHLLLFGLTFLSTTFIGMQMSLGRSDAGVGWPIESAGFWAEALSYSVSIMAILTAHEMGHFLAARKRGIHATWPYFIPVPLGFGTFGAFIRMRLNKQVPAEDLLRVAAYGPLAGLAVILPVLGIGMWLSEVRPAPEDVETGVALGDSVILWISEKVIFGTVPAGSDVWLHPMAFAGWAGLLVTAINLIPLSQLDGGHIAYCLAGERFNLFARGLLAVLVLLSLFVYWPWLILSVMVTLLGAEHPPLSPDAPVRTRSGRALALITLSFLVLCFTPVPVALAGGAIPELLELLR